MTIKPMFNQTKEIPEPEWSSFKDDAIAVARQAMANGLVLSWDGLKIEKPEDVFSDDNDGEYLQFNGDANVKDSLGISFLVTVQNFIPQEWDKVFELTEKPYCVLAAAMVILMYNHCRSSFDISPIEDIKSSVWLDAMALVVKTHPNHTWFLPGFSDFSTEPEKGHEYITISALFIELGINISWRDELKTLLSPELFLI